MHTRVTEMPTSPHLFASYAGDCVMSSWSEWSACDCKSTDSNATRTRQRRVLKAALPSGVQCQSTVETESCTCQEYALAIGEWTSCLTTGECGKGNCYATVFYSSYTVSRNHWQDEYPRCVNTSELSLSTFTCNLSNIISTFAV